MNIKIALSGQIDRDTKITYSYPEKYDSDAMNPATKWLLGLFDPRTVAREFDAKKVFVYWNNANGNYYGMIIPNRQDTRNGFLMITIFSGNDIIYDGKALEAAFMQLEKMLILSPVEPSDSDMARLADSLGTSMPVAPVSMSVSGSIGYRSYNNMAELCRILGNCDQSDYSSISKAVFIPAMSAPKTPVAGFSEITAQLKVAYTVAKPLPEGVRVDKERVRIGDVLTIFFDKEGFTSEKVAVNVTGMPDDKVKYTANEIIINPPARAISFSRKTRLDVVDENGNPISGLRINGGANQCKMQGKTIEFLNPADEYDITITTNSGKSVNVRITAADLSEGVKSIVIPLGVAPAAPARPAGPQVTVSSSPLKYVLYGLCGLIGIYLLYATVMAWSAGVAWPFNSAAEKEQIAQEDSIKQEAPQGAESATAETEDINYMRSTTSWDINKLKSQKYRQLADYIRTGNVDAIVAAQWFNALDEPPAFCDINNILRSLTPERKTEASDIMKSSGDIVNLSDIYSRLKSLNNPAPAVSSSAPVDNYRPASVPATRPERRRGPSSNVPQKNSKKESGKNSKSSNNQNSNNFNKSNNSNKQVARPPQASTQNS